MIEVCRPLISPKDLAMKKSLILICPLLIVALGILIAAGFPQAEISNGLVRAKLYLPDPGKGFYRGTRFDWSGVISSLEHKSHNYFGQWFTRYDPKIRDIDFDPAANGYAAGPGSASMGPVEEFATTLGFDEAKAGGTFIKIGVGVLRKTEEPKYDHFFRYEIVDPGKWIVRKGRDWVEFVHELTDASGYAYIYRKTVRLSKDKPELVLEHSLKNSGKRLIETNVYNHNFFVMDNQPSGPDFVIKFPFEMKDARDKQGIVEVRGKEIVYLREMQKDKDERASILVGGYSDSAKDYNIRVENRKTGAAVRITADRPLARLMFWSIRTVRSPEAFINVRVEPGSEFKWRISYEFYTLPSSGAN